MPERYVQLHLLIPVLSAAGTHLRTVVHDSCHSIPEELDEGSVVRFAPMVNGAIQPIEVDLTPFIEEKDLERLTVEIELDPVVQLPTSEFEVVRNEAGEVIGIRRYGLTRASTLVRARGDVDETYEPGEQG